MTEPPPPVFRSQALAHHGGRDDQVAQLRLAWMRPAPPLLLALIALALLAGLFVPVDEHASGPLLVGAGGRSFVAALPVTARAALESGRPLELSLGGDRVAIPPRGIVLQTVDLPAATKLFGGAAVAGLAETADAALLVRGGLPAPAGCAAPCRGRVSVRLRSEALLRMLVSGFSAQGIGG